MPKNEYLNEEKYQNNKKKISKIALIILIIGVLIGGSLIATGLIKQNEVNSKYSEESKESLQEKIETEKKNLEIKKAELQAKGIQYNAFANYDDGEVYDLYIVTKALDPSFDYCAFDEYKNNALTSKYCLYTQQLDDFTDFNKSFDSHDSIPFYMFGAFIIIASCMIAFSIYMFTKRREMLAFAAQQVMPVAQEGIEKMSPTIGNAAGIIGKELAKGISDGIRESKKEDEENN